MACRKKFDAGIISILIGIITMLVMSCSSDKSKDHQLMKDLPDTASAITKKIAEDPGNASLYYERAKLLIATNHNSLAMKDLNKAIELEPDMAVYYQEKADLLWIQGSVREALANLKTARLKNRKDPDILLKLAEVTFIIGDYKNSQRYLDTLRDNFDANSEGWVIRGFVFLQTEDTLSAIKSFEEATRINPDNYRAFLQLGVIYTHLKNPVCLEYYQTALELKPGSAEVYYNMGWYYQQTNDFNRAIELYNHLLTMKDGGGLKPNAYYNLGYLHIQMKMWSEARDYFGKAIQLNPKYVEAYYAKGFAHEMLGDIMNAKAYYEEALKLRPSYPNAYNALQRINNTMNR